MFSKGFLDIFIIVNKLLSILKQTNNQTRQDQTKKQEWEKKNMRYTYFVLFSG
jgi:hypothetical protein